MSRSASGTLDRIVTARKMHRCEFYTCNAHIEPGTRHVVTALPPHTDVNTSDHWWTMRLCPECHPIPDGAS